MWLFKKTILLFLSIIGLLCTLVFIIEPSYIRSIVGNFTIFLIKKNIDGFKYPQKLIDEFKYQEKNFISGGIYNFEKKTPFFLKITKKDVEPADIIIKVTSGTLILDHVIEFDSSKRINIFDSVGHYIPFHTMIMRDFGGTKFSDTFTLSLDYSFSGNANPYSTLILNPDKYPDVFLFFNASAASKLQYSVNFKYR